MTSSATEAPAAVEVTMPETGSPGAATVVRWLCGPGGRVDAGDPLLIVNWENQAAEIEAPAEGVLRAICVEAGSPAPAGSSLAVIDVAAPEPPPPPELDLRRYLSPAVRRYAREHGLDPSAVEGSGRDGRVTLVDLRRI